MGFYLVGPALGFALPDPQNAESFVYRGWPVPAKTTVFRFDGQDAPTVFITHARQGDSVLNVYTVVPRPLTTEEIERHLAGTHAGVLDGVEFQEFGSWSAPE